MPAEHEEAAGGDSVGQHDEDGSVEAGRGETENSEDDKPEVADRRVGDQFFQVGLDE